MEVKIVPLNLRQKDKRGKVCDLFLKNKKHFLFFFCRKGKPRAHHYHLAKSRSKNPENLIVLKGRIRLYCEDIKTGEKKTFTISKPSHVIIWPFVYHEYHFLTDAILFEPNEEDFVAQDVVWPYGKNGELKKK